MAMKEREGWEFPSWKDTASWKATLPPSLGLTLAKAPSCCRCPQGPTYCLQLDGEVILLLAERGHFLLQILELA